MCIQCFRFLNAKNETKIWLGVNICKAWHVVDSLYVYHRIRIYTEEKAKVVAAYWGTELLKFLASLFFAPGRVEEQGANQSILQLVLVQNN